jgi:(p)ppGpp synthase/HD superfamily hydrolase
MSEVKNPKFVPETIWGQPNLLNLTQGEYDRCRIEMATQFAVQRHNGEFRESGSGNLPYASHLFQGCRLLWRWGIDTPDNIVTFLCHDLLENTKTQWIELVLQIGYECTMRVDEMTFIPPPGLSNKEKADLKAQYMASFDTKSIHAVVLKIADRVVNTTDFVSFKPDYAGKYFAKADPLFAAFYRRQNKVVETFGAEAFERIVQSIEKVRDKISKLEAK